MSRQGNDKDGMRPIGDIIKMSNLPKRINRESRLMLAAGEIHDLTTLERDDVSYWPRGLVQCTLPYSNPGNVRAYIRRSGNYFLMIEPGTKIDRKTRGRSGLALARDPLRCRPIPGLAWCAATVSAGGVSTETQPGEAHFTQCGDSFAGSSLTVTGASFGASASLTGGRRWGGSVD